MTIDDHPRNYVTAPFTPEQIEQLQRWQASTRVHPFTCVANGVSGSVKHSDARILVPTEDGMVCPFEACGYTQIWVRRYMVDGTLDLIEG